MTCAAKTYPESLLKHPGQAAFFRSASDVILKEIEFDGVGPHERIIHVDACGICGTDVNAIMRGEKDYTPVGHEVAGRVVNHDGSLASETIVLESSSACGRCSSCRNARQDLCTEVKSFFRRTYFGIAENMVTPEISIVPYTNLTPAVASLSEPLGVAIDLCEVAGIGMNSVVLVAGLGPIGLMALRLAKLAGAAKIYGASFSHSEKRNALALEFGADELLFEDEKPLSTRHLDPPPDRILSTVPPNAIGACVPVAAMGGIITYIGVGHGETDRIVLPANDFHFKKLQLRSSFAAPAMRTPLALELLKSDRVAGRKLITHCFPLREAGRAIAAACKDKKEVIKVVVVNES
jgi:threonine dehydrogenase-like Zn-dependent dehydrogenase